MELWEKTLESQTLFEGKIVTVKLDQAQLVDGTVARREVVEHPGGVCILPLFDDGTVSIVRQFRYPFQAVVTELPAGKLEKGEDHRPAAIRELAEEVGVTCGKLTYLGCLYLSPGFSTEVLHMYLAQELKQGQCHPDADEFLEAERVPFSQLLAQVLSGEIVDAKTVALVLKTRQLLDL
ncbi:NUDIX domain-containing protein [uncultured Flavonifractor sp.]|uniref:NUDIX domain-containing protein n=1 Tax=uncultured Flavonifractor sp. TaxID=1193534 RepID=UPI002613279B|nr:NUDIX hydrolase [uncultured Flavonifractor sp.]